MRRTFALRALFLALSVFATTVVADNDYRTRFIELGMDGDLAGARVVLAEWAQARPDDAMLGAMRALLADWEADAARHDPYAPLGRALMLGDYAGARAALADAADHPAATAIQQQAFAAWIERFKAHDQGPTLAALQLEYSEFEVQRLLPALATIGTEAEAANAELDAALGDLNVLLESVAADLESSKPH